MLFPSEEVMWQEADDLLSRIDGELSAGDDGAAPIVQIFQVVEAIYTASEDKRAVKRLWKQVTSGDIHMGLPYPVRP